MHTHPSNTATLPLQAVQVNRVSIVPHDHFVDRPASGSMAVDAPSSLDDLNAIVAVEREDARCRAVREHPLHAARSQYVACTAETKLILVVETILRVHREVSRRAHWNVRRVHVDEVTDRNVLEEHVFEVGCEERGRPKRNRRCRKEDCVRDVRFDVRADRYVELAVSVHAVHAVEARLVEVEELCRPDERVLLLVSVVFGAHAIIELFVVIRLHDAKEREHLLGTVAHERVRRDQIVVHIGEKSALRPKLKEERPTAYERLDVAMELYGETLVELGYELALAAHPFDERALELPTLRTVLVARHVIPSRYRTSKPSDRRASARSRDQERVVRRHARTSEDAYNADNASAVRAFR